jgi:hypothetical protein
MHKTIFSALLSLSLVAALGSSVYAATVVPYTFSVEIDGVLIPGVTTIDGPSASLEFDATTGAKVYSYQATYYSPLTNNIEFPRWLAKVKAGAVDRRSMSIIRSKAGVEDSRFNLFNCIPKGFEIKNGSGSILLGTVTCDTMEMKSQTPSTGF